MNEEELFQIDNEEDLDEIEYYEIVSLEEIIKLNPTFVAFTNEEIFNYLFNFFKSKSKADGFLNLFIKIIERQKKKVNTNNFIIVADASRDIFTDKTREIGKYLESLFNEEDNEEDNKEDNEEDNKEDNEEDNEKGYNIVNFIKKIKDSNKQNVFNALKNKNKLWFPLIYNSESSKLKFNTSLIDKSISIDLKKPYINDRYILFKDDERDIPILGVYFYEPIVLDDDYLNEKIVSFLIENDDKKKQKKEFKESNDYDIFEELISDYKLKLPLDKIDIEEYHFNNINSLFKKINKDLDFINKKDFEILKKHLEKLSKTEKEINIKYTKKDNIQNVDLTKNRLLFFKYLDSSKKLAELTLKSLEKLKEKFQKYNSELTEIEYLDIVKDIGILINNINEENYDVIIKNIREVRKNIIILNSVDFFKKIFDMNEFDTLFKKIEDKYNLMFNTYKDIFHISFSFNEDEAEIIKGANIDDYEGVPVIIDEFKKNAVYVNEDYNEDFDDNNDDDKEEDKYELFKEYYYNIEKGYSEALKIVLPFIEKMRIISKLPINYDLITNHLFNIYRGIPEKEILIKKTLQGDYNEDYYKEQALKSFKYVIMSDDETEKLKEANVEYMKIIIDMIYDVICKWSILTQNDLITDNLLFVRDRCYLPCIELWNDYGAPFDMNSKDGIIYYLICVFVDVYNEEYSDIDYNFFKLDKNYKKIILEKLKSNYKNELDNYKGIEIKNKKENKGLESGKQLIEILNKKDNKNKNKILDAFIEALVYMPAYKYQKIHKYLLGCCLEKIDENFTADTFINNERKDLKKAKSKFASDRVLNKSRYKRFYLIKDEISKEKIVFKEISNYIKYNDFYEKTLDEWFEDILKNKNTILTKEIIETIRANLRNTYLIHINNYISTFFSKAFGLLLKEKKYNFDNYRQILNKVSNILYINLKDNALEIINNIKETIKELDKLSSIINDENITDIYQIRAIIVIRALCLPSYPIISENPKLIPKIDISPEIIKRIISDMNKKIISLINNYKMPTEEEQKNYINKIRESNKDKIIAALNKKSREEKDVIKELKKIGLEVKDDDDVKELNIEKEQLGDDEPEDDREYILGEEDNMNDDDNLDTQDFGFIYAD